MNRISLLALALSLVAIPAFAHTGHELGGFTAGFVHPLGGLDHLLTMVSVGLWAGQLGGRATWLVPTAFVGTMVAGGALALSGVGLPMVEVGIGLSVLAIGALVALKVRVPVALGMGIAALFALFHGHAHGAEMPGASHPAAYAAGFILATAALHGLGIALSLAIGRRIGALAVRIGGAGVAAAGLFILVG